MEIATPNPPREIETWDEESEDWVPSTVVDPALCWECEAAECTPYPSAPFIRDAIESAGSGAAYECQKQTDAEWERENDLYIRYDRVGKPRPEGKE